MVEWFAVELWGFRFWAFEAESVGSKRPRAVASSEFRVQGSGSRIQGSGFRVQGSGFRVQDSGFRVQGLGFRVQGIQLGFSIHDSE